MVDLPRVVITGVGLTSPNGNSLDEYRQMCDLKLRPGWSQAA